MRQIEPSPHVTSIGRWPALAQWGVLVSLSAAIGATLWLAGIPAALLLGPMLAAIAASLLGVSIKVGRWPYYGSQSLVGCLIASTFSPTVVMTVSGHWAVFLSAALSTYAVSLGLGMLMARLRVLPGSTAIWGSSPGAASAMMLMAEAFGADARIVAFMQYLRVVFVALAASIVAKIWIGEGGGGDPVVWFPHLSLVSSVETVALAAFGALVRRLTKLPAGPLLVPMVVGGLLHATGTIDFDLPPWLLASAYAFVGWKIGLGFTRDVLQRAMRAFVPIVVNVVVLILLCGGFAWMLVHFLGIDPLTAYLATSPGGMDSVAIIAASAKTDLPFVMALHAMRFVIVLAFGPAVARFIARRMA